MNRLPLLLSAIFFYAVNASHDSIRGKSHKHATRRLEVKTVTGECTVENFIPVVGTKETLTSLLGLEAGTSDSELIMKLKDACDAALVGTR